MTGSRDIDPSTLAAATAPTIHPVILVKLQLDGGDVLVHSELGNLTFGGDTYSGVGTFGGMSQAQETSDLSRTPLTLTLGGIPNTMIAVVLGQHYQGRRATVYLGYLDRNTRTLVADPTVLYRGNIDTADVQQDKEFTVTLSVESRFAAWDRPRVRRYNNSDQQSRHPGDTGLQYIEQTADKNLLWGGPG